YVNCPRGGVERRRLEGHGIGAGIDRAADRFPVPRHDDGGVVPLLGRCSPVAVPRADERIPFLRGGRRREEQGKAHAAKDGAHGTILRPRDTDSSAPTIDSGERLLSWQMYSKSSVPGLHRRMNPPVHGAVYAPGSSTVASYFSELKSVRVNRS